ncbi:type II toxin-antitoxin system PemK/MazF family toxin [Testudinibacter sp. TR-2022]|uniref:type II toxin-antitoxin system PemK/MazF family toxin n=1 Tax=Testudinibacter sp. TR-2022 TaxID=2585029 RepID=UPI001119ECDF|nr:type II toxin-antitoxin system PemK/MazF family toxin [Testudinibacter sp. TR-2022]TNH06625.1 hypothetical protein FHQ30_07200 [Pasteurellaceae bacterium Phil11]TNH25537.1 hypothetical protein FHQ29_01325 [Testudinibacter sp. TR-2022]TNH25684.1 hypothetical protein FHQ27_08770 [Testudinibacter sp. TR-2022]
MSIQQHRPKVGEILECHYGAFSENDDVNGHIPPEIIKKRMVVVLNGKLNGLALVVPISSTKSLDGIQNGLHIEVAPDLIRTTGFYDKRVRWAKAELIQAVSRKRLFHIYDKGSRITQYLPRDVVEKIQRAVIKAVNASTLLDKAEK